MFCSSLYISNFILKIIKSYLELRKIFWQWKVLVFSIIGTKILISIFIPFSAQELPSKKQKNTHKMDCKCLYAIKAMLNVLTLKGGFIPNFLTKIIVFVLHFQFKKYLRRNKRTWRKPTVSLSMAWKCIWCYDCITESYRMCLN